MNKLILIISFTLFSTIEVTAQITEDVAKEFFNSAYNAYCEHDYPKSLYMLDYAEKEGYSKDSILKYRTLIKEKESLDKVLEKGEFLYKKKQYVKASDIYRKLPSEIQQKITWITKCNEIVDAIKKGTAISEGLAGYMNKKNPNITYGFEEGFACIEKSWRKFWIDKYGHELSYDKRYEFSGVFRKGIFIARSIGGDALYDINSKCLYKNISYDRIWPVVNGVATVRKNKKIGYIDSVGIEIIPCQYTDGGNGIFEGLIRVCKGKKWGYIDVKGKPVINFKYKDAGDFSEGLAPVLIGNKYGFINRSGQLKISPQFDAAWNFSCGYAAVRIGSDWFFVNHEGINEFRKTFADIGYLKHQFCEGIALVREKHDKDSFSYTKYGYFSKDGKFITPYIFSGGSRSFSEGMAVICYNGKYGYINAKGDFYIKPIYENAKPFSEGMAHVVLNGWHGFIDKYNITTFDYSSRK